MFILLTHVPGEAQADVGEALVVIKTEALSALQERGSPDLARYNRRFR
jgi:hypothetical protein